MKNISFLSMAMVAGLSVSAQSNMFSELPAKYSTDLRNVSVEVTPTISNRADIWSDGFETPADWTLSRTASNASPYGWYISDSIYANTWRNWHADDFELGQGNFAFVNNGDPLTGSSTPPIQGEAFDLTYTTAISVTGYENSGFVVSFDIDGRRYYDQLETYISGDGVNWVLIGDLSDIEPLTINQPVNYMNSIRRFYSVAPSDFNSSSNVYLRFSWNGSAASGISYGMMIDNIAFEVLPDNDLEMRAVWTDDFFRNPIYEVLQVPENMASARTFVAIVKNNGATAKDVYVEAIISTASGDVTINSSASPVNIDPNESDTVYLDFDPSDWDVSNYSIAMTALAVGVTISEDLTPANNSKTAQFDVTNNTLASFPRNYTGNSLSGNYIDVDNDGTRDIIPVVYLNQYLFFENATAYAIGTAFADASVADTEIGAQVTWQIYEEVGGNIDLNSPLVSGANLEIANGSPQNVGLTEAMINTERIVLPFNTLDSDGNGGFTIVPDPLYITGDVLGKSYAVAVTLPADAIAFMRVNADENDDASTLAYGDLGSGGVDFYRNFSHCIIELYLHENALSVAEQANRPDFYLAQNRPNPFNGGTTITYQLNKKANNISFEVFDVTGKQVMNINEGAKGAGQYNIMLDGSEFTIGLYYYSLTVNGQKLTRKMVITE